MEKYDSLPLCPDCDVINVLQSLTTLENPGELPLNSTAHEANDREITMLDHRDLELSQSFPRRDNSPDAAGSANLLQLGILGVCR